ncbi:ABC transporter ATP-binding protein [Corynebacterium confusum]|uniref:ABC transporter ATP-binding protein n=1 Tax=Corynebacterium confusum TaxID=71254 RepID=UPI0025B5F283|nr:ABC transporter ATP-binding protein [Corynebacterium confusum]WJY90732.1 Iron(3+)-hydroxamate import ATP-binding protein FhuC [Corynebacterium confusum]
MAITVDNLSFRYGRHIILDGISFGPLKEGRVTGLLGPNAAGKSTLLNTIAGLKQPAGGRVHLTRGETELSKKERRTAIGYVPQDILSTASLTAFESLMVTARRSHRPGVEPVQASADTLELLGITYLADRLVSQMSGGQRQLVSVAQVLVGNPDILLLDEPTSALDLRHQIKLLKVVRSTVANSARQAVVAIHDVNLAARYCDDLLVIKGGKALAHGTPTEVLTPELIAQVYGIEATILDDAGTPVICPVSA